MATPVDITVSRLRDALWHAAGRPGVDADGPGAIAGGIFHETVAGLLRGDASWQSVLRPGALGDHAALRQHAYSRFVGPRLSRYEAALKESGREARWLWTAIGGACEWICGILTAADERGLIRYDADHDSWIDTGLIATEEPAEREFHRPGWSAPVRIHGIADAVLRDPATGRWCCVEFKLSGAGGPVDVCQAALYQALLDGEGQRGDVAVVRFAPERRETLLTAAQLSDAREKLIDLAGAVAGVTGGRAPLRTPVDDARYVELGRRMSQVLATFNAPVSVCGRPVVGPTFVRFMLKPGRAVAVRRILNAADDLGVQLGMPAPFVDVEDGVLVVDVARGEDREIVPFSRVREALRAADPVQGSAEIPLGVDLNNRVRWVDISSAESPHVLVAGTAGSGKSEWLRTAIAALLIANTPDTLRLVLIDPKRTAFGDMARSPYLLDQGALLFPPDGSVEQQLDRMIEEMERRYREFHSAGVDDLKQWRSRTSGVMPRIVCVIDEFADMMADPRDRRALEDRVVRLGAKARAAGVHLMLATQHPDAKTVTGRLQANLSVRVCLKTATWQQSMVALKRRGAERLLGKGDLFFSRGDRLLRVQAAYLDEAERHDIFHGRERVPSNAWEP